MKNKVLIVDDDEISSKLLSALVGKLGHDAVTLNDASDILNVVELQQIDVVLLDIMMPGVDGFQAIQNLRAKYNSFSLPIIMVSSKVEGSDIAKALELGASDYVTKPVDKVVLKARIETQTQLMKIHKLDLKNKEIESINRMVAKYNHQINNTLAKSLGYLDLFKKKGGEDKLEKLSTSLREIADIVSKIKVINDDG